MSIKRDVWVVLRNDTEDKSLLDAIGVKGVYDSPEAADNAVRKAEDGNREFGAYRVVRSRRLLDANEPPDGPRKAATIQGFSGERRISGSAGSLVSIIDDLRQAMPPGLDAGFLRPLIPHLAEVYVARSLNAKAAAPRSFWDIEMPDGGRVEIKTTVLNAERNHAPQVSIRDLSDFDWLAIVVFTPDLDIELARLIPRSAVALHVRSVDKGGMSRPTYSLRVTPALVNAPGALEITGL